MSYTFDRDYRAEDSSTGYSSPTGDFDNLFNGYSQSSHSGHAGSQGNFQTTQQPRVDAQQNIDVETWKYGEGEFDYLADNPSYGNHGMPVATSSHRKPWVHYFIVDNIKYVVVMVIFYFLFMARLDSLGIEGLRYQTIRDELFACYIGLLSLLFFKSMWRLFKMK